ncbi:MAG: hypothetical protein KDC10_16700, partial [Calditrichaeota bacterium]|nr:hypothetical protein [Calditrichota bacterium]
EGRAEQSKQGQSHVESFCIKLMSGDKCVSGTIERSRTFHNQSWMARIIPIASQNQPEEAAHDKCRSTEAKPSSERNAILADFGT